MWYMGYYHQFPIDHKEHQSQNLPQIGLLLVRSSATLGIIGGNLHFHEQPGCTTHSHYLVMGLGVQLLRIRRDVLLRRKEVVL